MMERKKNNPFKDYRGFDLDNITWGYRDIFRETIDNLFDSGLIGDDNPDVTKAFFGLLKSRERESIFDHALKNFLSSLNKENSWIMRIPRLFGDWVSFGAEVSEHKLNLGMRYFELWGEGAFGRTPEDVSYVLKKAKTLGSFGYDLSISFISSFRKLRSRLSLDEIDYFIQCALELRVRTSDGAIEFMGLKTKTANYYLNTVSKEARLSDISSKLCVFSSSIADRKIDIKEISELDSDELIERGSHVVCIQNCIYLPGRVNAFKDKQGNLNYYMLMSAVSASSILFGSFSKFHGKGEACNSLEYIRMARKSMTRSDIINNCFICMETCRIIKLMCDRFPGTAGIIFLALKTERKNNIHGTTILELISLALSGKPLHAVTNDFFELKSLLYKICGLKSCEETIAEITKFSSDEEGWKKLEHFFQTTPAPLSFFPDFMFNGMVSESPPLSLGLDGRKPPQMKNEGQEKKESKRAEDDNLALSDVYHDKTGYENSQGKKGDDIEMGFLYDEWNQQSDDYFEKWCLTREKKVLSSRELNVSQEHQYLARRVRRFFEALKPDLARKEKYLPDGDDINIDMLMDFISMRKARICPNIKFYEKSRIKKRDICVAILVDMSGSTSDDAGQGGKIIDLEKISAYILGEGLCETGDKFGIFGFSGNGRRNAEFFILKDFDSEWNDESKGAVFNVQPRSSTRIGVALRHAGQKLSKMSSKKKILILITDGKPMDSEYDSGSRYAQFDVRKANEENSKFGIDSFCISTEENSAEDLELMFPVKRFVIIKGMGELPSLLSRFYLRLTK